MEFARSVVPEELEDRWHWGLIHISALVCLSASVVCCVLVIVLTFFKETKANSIKSFFKLPIGERLVFYLAIIGMGYCCSHMIDHCYILFTRQNPPDVPCSMIAFLVLAFVVAYQLMNIFMALNAFMMTVKQRKVGTGRHDWRLLGCCFGTGLLVVLILLATRHLGPGGAWYVVSYHAIVNKARSVLNLE